MLNCSRCKSDRLLQVNAKCNDLCTVQIGSHEKSDYAPKDLGIGGGDYINFTVCLNCGQAQGSFPLPKSELESELSDEDQDELERSR